MNALLDLVLPRRCAACGAAADGLCAGCLAALRLLRAPRCARCGAPTAWPVERCRECAGRRLAFAAARAAYAYAGPARALVRAWKERGLRHLAALAAELTASAVERPEVDVVVPVPPDEGRLLGRGHHPPERLAAELARRWSLESAPLLRRTRAAPRQTALARDERGRNVRRLFATSGRAPPRVVLVDDVYTTGSTVAAAASALRAAGAHHVEVVTFARAVR
ncbi:MAG TPA: double zinc ribbon domain-containing protein [Gaiellaceae bacterium]